MGARGGRRLAAGGLTLLLLGAAAGYGVADATNRVPGPLTQDPVPQAYPDLGAAPGAVLPPPVVAAGATPLDDAAPVPSAEILTAAVAPVLADSALGPSVSATVLDATTGDVLLEAGTGGGHEPASVTKILTSAAALHRLGPGHTVDTTAVTSGDGPVVLVGGGDLLLAAGAGNLAAANGRAGLADLADQTAAALAAADRTTVRVQLDDSIFEGVGTGQGMGPGWTSSDVSNGFVAPMTGLAVNAGRTTDDDEAPRVGDPGLAAAATFAALLGERGITVQGAPARGAAPTDGTVLGTVTSASLAEVVGYVLATSDNNGAEALARLVAHDAGTPTGFAGAGQAVLAEVEALGVSTEGLRLSDGSGLADGSVLTPTAVAGVLHAAASPDHPELRPLLTGLPIAGLTGTLVKRFGESSRATAGQGLVRAKTGSLRGVTTLAGTVVDADGRLLAFAVMADDVPSGEPARAATDRVVAMIAGCGCR